MSYPGVTPAGHKAALMRLYSTIAPEKVPQVPLMWTKFGTGIWEALGKKYPDKDISSYAPRSLAAEALAAAGEAEHTAALKRFYMDVNPEKLAQISPAWRKFGAGVWQALAAKYPDSDLAEYAPNPSASSGNPFTRSTPAPAPAPVPAPAPAAPVGTGNPFAPKATGSGNPFEPKAAPAPAAVSLEPEVFTGVSHAEHIEGLRTFYSAVNPDRLSQLDLMMTKFGAGIWKALASKYPDKDVARYAPIPSRGSNLAPNLSGMAIPRREATPEDVFGADAAAPEPEPAPAPAPPMPKAASLFDSTPAPAPAPSLFGGDASQSAGARSLFSDDAEDNADTPAADGEEGGFARALLEEEAPAATANFSADGATSLFGAEDAEASKLVSGEGDVDDEAMARMEAVTLEPDTEEAPAPAPAPAVQPIDFDAPEPEEAPTGPPDYDSMFNVSIGDDADAAPGSNEAAASSLFAADSGIFGEAAPASAVADAAAAGDLFAESGDATPEAGIDTADIGAYIAAQHPNASA